LGSGVDVIYPSSNRQLADRILLSGGVIISEQPIGRTPRAQFFPARNRIISGLSKATLVIEAQKKSGSLITAQCALQQNRDVYAVPGSIFSENQEGTNQLIAEGAIPICSTEQLLKHLDLHSETRDVIETLVFDSTEE